MNKYRYTYFYNENTRELQIYDMNRLLATVQDVNKKSINMLFRDIVFELRGEEV